MAVVESNTFSDGFTPVCNDCGIFLCWDIDADEYERDRAFWDAWKCRDCNGGVAMSRKRGLPPRELIQPSARSREIAALVEAKH